MCVSSEVVLHVWVGTFEDVGLRSGVENFAAETVAAGDF